MGLPWLHGEAPVMYPRGYPIWTLLQNEAPLPDPGALPQITGTLAADLPHPFGWYLRLLGGESNFYFSCLSSGDILPCGILELWLVASHALWPFPGPWGLTVCSCQEDRFLFSLIPFSDTSLAISKEYRENGSTLKATAIFSIVSIFGVLMLFSHCPICC